MAGYSKKSLLKLALLSLLVFALSLQIAAASISFSLGRYPLALKLLLEACLGAEVSFTRVSYGLSQGLSFENLSIRMEGETLGFCKSLQFRIALFPLIKKRLWINRIIIRDGWLSSRAASHAASRKDFFFSRVSSGKPLFTPAWKRLSVVLRDVKLYLAGGDKSEYLGLDSRIILYRENVSCSAELDFGNTRFKKFIINNPFLSGLSQKINLQIQLAFMGEDLLVNNITVANNAIKIAGAGIIYDFDTRPSVDIRIISVPLNLREIVNYKDWALMNGILNIAANFRSGKAGMSLSGEMMMGKGEMYLPKQTVHLSNLFMQVNLKDNRLEIKDLTALINSKYPFSLHGYIADFTRPRINLTLGSFKTNRAKDGLEDSVLVNLNLDGHIEDFKFLGDVAMRYTRRKQYPHYLTQRTMDLEMDGIKFIAGKKSPAGNLGALRLVAEGLRLSHRKIVGLKSTVNQRLELSDLVLNLSLDQQDRLAAELNAGAYGGKIDGLGHWRLEGMRPGDFFLLRFKGLRAEEMQAAVPENIRLAGELSGILHLLNQNGLELGGAFTVNNGRLSRFIILDNIADFLGIKSLKDLNGVTLSADFLWSGLQLSIRRFNLKGPVVELHSGFALNQNQWATGTANLVLQRRVLEESDILRRLLSIAGEVGERVEFEFRISGFPQALRVELQESKFRDQLVKKLSGPLRARIENEINKAMDAFRNRHTP